MRVFLFVLTVSVFIPFAILTAQQNPLQPGSRVRITAPYCGLSQQAGTLEPSLGDTLVLAYGASNARCPRSNVTHLEVSRGRKSHPGPGAGIGAVILGVSGAIAASKFCKEAGSDFNCDPDRAPWIGAAAGGAVGALLGAAIGAASKTDRWEEVPLDRLRVSFAPQRDGFAFGLTVSF